MKCPNCQSELTGGEKFGIKCGTRIPETVTPESAPEKPAQPVIITPKPMAETEPEKPAKIEPIKPENIKPEPDIKDPESMIVKTEVSAPPVFCIKCGAKMQPTAKFCTKCGNPVDKNQKPAGASSAVASTAKTPAAADTSAASVSVPAGEKAPKKKNKGLVVIIVLVICALIVAILLALKSAGVLANLTSVFSGNTETEEQITPEDNAEPEDEEDEDENSEEDEAAALERLEQIEAITADINAYVEEGDASELISDSYRYALEEYVILASEYDMADEISEDASEVFAKYAQQVRNSVALLDGQKVSSGLYIQSRIYYDEILGCADAMTNAGIRFDDCGITAESDDLIETYRDKYIFAVNEITSRESWSRDEAWTLMEDAASVLDTDGSRALFNDDDPDDPMRLRFIYALAWKTRKDIETGIANGEMSYEDALDRIDAILRDTDYNLMLLHDGIYYSDLAGIDSEPYTLAFNSEIEKMEEYDNVLVVLDPAKADDTHIDMNHFWIFNDISDNANPAYQVSYTNGTSAATRAWIRENIRVNR